MEGVGEVEREEEQRVLGDVHASFRAGEGSRWRAVDGGAGDGSRGGTHGGAGVSGGRRVLGADCGGATTWSHSMEPYEPQ